MEHLRKGENIQGYSGYPRKASWLPETSIIKYLGRKSLNFKKKQQLYFAVNELIHEY